MKGIKKVFRAIDKNSNGSLTKLDVLNGYQKVYKDFTMKQVDEIFSRIDFDGNGVITISEFITAAIDR